MSWTSMMLSSVTALYMRNDVGDFSDLVNHRYTVIILIVCSLIVTAKDYAFKPIQCWIPAQFPKYWEEYVENYCWVQNTYFVPMNTHIPNTFEKRSERELKYYQWAALILLLQAFLFYAPYIVWSSLNSVTGVNVDSVRSMAADCLTTDVRVREKLVEALASYFARNFELLRFAKERPDANLIDRYIRQAYITNLYFITKRVQRIPLGTKDRRAMRWTCSKTTKCGHVKQVQTDRTKEEDLNKMSEEVMYIGNSFGQFFLLNALLGTRDTLYGLRVLLNLIHGVEWRESSLFPRVTLCDIHVRTLGNAPHVHSVQCVLATNMINEKIFVFIWFWLLGVTLVNLLNLVHWVFRTLPRQRHHFVCQMLADENRRSFGANHKLSQSPSVKKFVRDHVMMDGVFLLRIIFVNYGAVLTSDIASLLWREFHGEIVFHKPQALTQPASLFPEEERVTTNSTRTTAGSTVSTARKARRLPFFNTRRMSRQKPIKYLEQEPIVETPIELLTSNQSQHNHHGETVV